MDEPFYFTRQLIRAPQGNLAAVVYKNAWRIYMARLQNMTRYRRTLYRYSLVGKGIGKSTLCRALAISPNEYFVDMGDKAGKELGTAESMRLISGKIVAELGEMISIRKSEIETVKSLSQPQPTICGSFTKRESRSYHVQPSFIGTSNPDQFLVDVTGNRRFFPLKIVAIDPWLTGIKRRP